MRYAFKEFKNSSEIADFFAAFYENSELQSNWIHQEGLKLYGYFYDKEALGLRFKYLFLFGQTIHPDEIRPTSEDTIFSKLKLYGSSRKYKGLRNFKGEIVLNNSYEDISVFYETELNVYLLLQKNSKVGVIRHSNDKIAVIAQCRYDAFFDANEYTWGFIIDNKVGFMSLNGDIQTEAKYKIAEDYNIFVNGKALTCVDSPYGVRHYINHYGDCIGYPETDDDTTWLDSTAYQGDSDILDAYEGDESNMWNTD